MTYPLAVQRNLAYLDARSVWYNVTRNLPAMSCADAAAKRYRLGRVGIPLCDELKSHVGAYTTEDGARGYVVIHNRGHQRRDDQKVRQVVGAKVRRVEADELQSAFGLSYGLVNPFVFAAMRPEVLQIFDPAVLEPYFAPGTMMTNCGDFEYGIEFRAEKLVKTLPRKAVEDVTTDASGFVPTDHRLGILTGNSPESGMELWRRITDNIRYSSSVHFAGDISFPRVIVESVPEMGASMELPKRVDDVRNVVLLGVRRLCESGASIIGIACNTTQYFSPEIREVCLDYGAEFVSMVDETEAALKERGISTFDFLGIGPVSDLEAWSDFRRISGKFDIKLPDPQDIERINQFAFRVKNEVVSSGTVQTLRNLIGQATRTDTVLLALTELSIVMASQKKKQRSEKVFIDTLQILADSMSRRYLAQREAVAHSEVGSSQ